MQVVYSGGSSTPTPSPRLQRKAYPGGYGRPMMPGYMMGHQPHQAVAQRSREKLTEGDTSLRDSIPAMSKPLAVTCLIFNILLPGLGEFPFGLLCIFQLQLLIDSLSSAAVPVCDVGVSLVSLSHR